MGKELEIKLTASMAETLDAVFRDEEVRRLTRSVKELEMESTYFDTAAGDLQQRHWVLRLRRENDTGVVTFKTPRVGLTRGEWEYDAMNLGDAGKKLTAMGAPAELETLLRNGVVPLCGASFFRKAVLLELEDGSTAELALDLGTVQKGRRQAPICEAELELKSGEPGAMLMLAARLAQRYGLKKETLGKFSRAMGL